MTEEDESESEYALVSRHQAYTSSDDDSINDIIDWRGRLMLGDDYDSMNDIIDYTDTEEEKNSPFVKIDCR